MDINKFLYRGETKHISDTCLAVQHLQYRIVMKNIYRCGGVTSDHHFLDNSVFLTILPSVMVEQASNITVSNMKNVMISRGQRGLIQFFLP